MRPFLLLATALALPVLALAQGALTPPSNAFSGGAPKATMKTLDQVEPRIPLVAGSPGVTINAEGRISIWAAGSYYLTGNLTVASGDGVAIWTSDVTFDLNGFTITSTATPAAGVAILFPGSSRNVTVHNGHIVGAATIDPVTGAHSGAGFINGVYSSDTLTNCLVSGLTVDGVRDTGIYLDGGSVIEHCAVTTCGKTGIRGQTVANCSATDCGQTAIIGTTVANSQGKSIAGAAILATIATNCTGLSAAGVGLSATDSATNCSGTTTSGAYGLRVATDDSPAVLGTAINCKGSALGGTGVGLSAGTVSDCTGKALGGTGLEAGAANNCQGFSTNGTGLSATEATNCYGKSTNGTRGLSAANTATGCTGEISVATGATEGPANEADGLFAATATNCRGSVYGFTGSCITIGVSAQSATNCQGKGKFGISGTTAQNCVGEGSVGISVTGTASFCHGIGPLNAIVSSIAVACTAGPGSGPIIGSKQLGTL